MLLASTLHHIWLSVNKDKNDILKHCRNDPDCRCRALVFFRAERCMINMNTEGRNENTSENLSRKSAKTCKRCSALRVILSNTPLRADWSHWLQIYCSREVSGSTVNFCWHTSFPSDPCALWISEMRTKSICAAFHLKMESGRSLRWPWLKY